LAARPRLRSGIAPRQVRRKLYQIITDKRASDHTSSIGGIENADASLPETASHDTLTPNDLQAEWRGVP